MLTVLCWYWLQPGGRVEYKPLHVAIWADMVRRNLSIPHRLAVVTNEDIAISGVEVIRPPNDFENVRIPSWPEHRPQCLRRLSMFRPDAADIFGDEILCMDLDLVIGGSLDRLFSGDSFKIAIGTAPQRPYNGSLIYLHAGARPEVYTRFSEEGAIEAGTRFVGSDQAWISYCLGPHEATFDDRDGLFYHGLPRRPTSPKTIMFFPGSEKPWMGSYEGWIHHNYRCSTGGRCLILGYGKKIWKDVSRAMDNGPYDAVIASPEAAEHWPGKILEIARDNLDAKRIAHLYGFDDLTWCGVEGEVL